MEEPRIAVIKIPREVNSAHIEGVAIGLRKAIGGPVLIIPMDYDVMMGKSAKEELERFHKYIHQILGGTLSFK